MPLISELRVIIETVPQPGNWNMAVDEVLLETAISSNIATLRWYQWSEPTVSLGYFQKLTDLSQVESLSKLPTVRRLSGGGAIVHDDEWTYCLALPASQTLFVQPHELYDQIHGPVAAGLNEMGFPVVFRGTTSHRLHEPLLCFQRHDEHDVTLFGKKVLGSAQRRRRGAIMQHGSLLRRASAFAPEILGLADLSQAMIPDSLANSLSIMVAHKIAKSWTFEMLHEVEREKAKLCVENMETLK